MATRFTLRHDGNVGKTVVTGIEMFRKVVKEARAGDKVGLLLREVAREQVAKGDVLTGV